VPRQMSLKFGGDFITMILSSCPAGRGAALLAGGGSQQEVGEGLRRTGCDIMLCLLLTSETVEHPPSERPSAVKLLLKGGTVYL